MFPATVVVKQQKFLQRILNLNIYKQKNTSLYISGCSKAEFEIYIYPDSQFPNFKLCHDTQIPLIYYCAGYTAVKIY